MCLLRPVEFCYLRHRKPSGCRDRPSGLVLHGVVGVGDITLAVDNTIYSSMLHDCTVLRLQSYVQVSKVEKALN